MKTDIAKHYKCDMYAQLEKIHAEATKSLDRDRDGAFDAREYS